MTLLNITHGEIEKQRLNRRLVYPSGKPRILHLLRCQRFAIVYYGFTFGALDLQHPRLLQH